MPASLPRNDYAGGGDATGTSAAAGTTDGYTVAELRKQYLDFSGSKRAELDEQRTARHYYHSDQWSKDEIAVQKKRRQPVVTDNQIGPLIDGMVGLIERLRQDPKAYPRTPNEEGGAELATSTLRYVLDAADWKAKSPEAARTGAINGIGGIELKLVAGDHGDPDLDFDLLDAETFFYDPRSVRHDFSDARFQGVAKWVDLEVAKEMFPDKAADLEGLIDSGGDRGMSSQIDREQRWTDTSLKRLFLVEHWYIKGGEWRFCFYTGDTELQSGQSPFVDEKDKTFCRFLPWSAYVDHDGDRYGAVRNMKSMQDEINMRRAKAMHILNSRRVIAETGAVDDVEKARVEVTRPDGFLLVNRDMRFDLDDTTKYADMKGQMEFLAEAKQNLENRAPNAALIGQGLENQSGRAIALLQQAGLAKLGPMLLAYRAWKIRVYRASWNIVQKVWTAERWVRVTDDEGAPQFIGINQVKMGPMGQQQPVNQIGALDVDIIIDEGPDSINMMADTLDALERLSGSGQPIPPEVIIEMSPLSGSLKKRIIGMIKQAQQPDPQKQQLGMADATSKIEETQSKTMLNKARAVGEAAKVAEIVHQPAQPYQGPEPTGGPAMMSPPQPPAMQMAGA